MRTPAIPSSRGREEQRKPARVASCVPRVVSTPRASLFSLIQSPRAQPSPLGVRRTALARDGVALGRVDLPHPSAVRRMRLWCRLGTPARYSILTEGGRERHGTKVYPVTARSAHGGDSRFGCGAPQRRGVRGSVSVWVDARALVAVRRTADVRGMLLVLAWDAWRVGGREPRCSDCVLGSAQTGSLGRGGEYGGTAATARILFATHDFGNDRGSGARAQATYTETALGAGAGAATGRLGRGGWPAQHRVYPIRDSETIGSAPSGREYSMSVTHRGEAASRVPARAASLQSTPALTVRSPSSSLVFLRSGARERSASPLQAGHVDPPLCLRAPSIAKAAFPLSESLLFATTRARGLKETVGMVSSSIRMRGAPRVVTTASGKNIWRRVSSDKSEGRGAVRLSPSSTSAGLEPIH
ncbi:hypothetical protein B0H11DRAFT_2288373 [Mycena galericulata]|nr:hypothetical protein B0H11DRAFT_2288373 [Mycena galericulata]